MIRPLFAIPLFIYPVNEWDRKKKALMNRVNKSNFDYYQDAAFQSDRQSNKNRYNLDFEQIFDEEFQLFKKEANVSYIKIKDIWTLKYSQKNENHCPHNHASKGFSGILYLEYDSKVHTPTTFIGPWNDPVDDKTQLARLPDPKPGVMYIWPSYVLHYAEPMQTNKLRMITSWDMDAEE